MVVKKKKKKDLFSVSVWHCAGFYITVNIIKPSRHAVPCSMTRVAQIHFLNPFLLIQGSYHRKYDEMLVILVPSLALGGYWAVGTVCEGDTIPAPCTKPCTACLGLIFFKIPSQLLKWSFGGDCRKCWRHSSGGWQVLLQSCNIQYDVL